MNRLNNKNLGFSPSYNPALNGLGTPTPARRSRFVCGSLYGFMLLELLIVVVLISVIALMAIPNVLSSIKEYSIRKNIMETQQIVKEARSIAIKKSSKVYVDFSGAGSNIDQYGGKIQIKKSSDDSLIKEYFLDKNNVYVSSQSTIGSSRVIFNYRGEPVDEVGDIYGITDSNNKTTLGYMGSDNEVILTRVINITPLSGTVVIQE